MVFVKKFPAEVYQYLDTHDIKSCSNARKEIKRLFGVDVSIGMIQFHLHPEWAEKSKLKKKGKCPPSFFLKPVGAERIDKDGYVRIITERGKERLKHHVVWEQATGKKPAKDEVLIFLNNDRTDCRFENLYCLKRKYLSALSWSKFRELPPEQMKLAINAVILAVEASAKQTYLRNQGNRSVIHKGNTIFLDYIQGYLEGKTVRQIAKDYDRGEASVRQSLRKYKNGGYNKWLDELGFGNLKPGN